MPVKWFDTVRRYVQGCKNCLEHKQLPENAKLMIWPFNTQRLIKTSRSEPFKNENPSKNMPEKTKKYTHYSLSLLIIYGSFYMFRHYIAIFRERS
jgi:hypothetical protein